MSERRGVFCLDNRRAGPTLAHGDHRRLAGRGRRARSPHRLWRRALRPAAARLGAGRSRARHAHRRRRSRSPTAAEQRPRQPVEPAAPKLARSETSVLVLNGNGIAGAAALRGPAGAPQGLRRRRGRQRAADATTARSVVMYRPGYAPEAARFARDLNVNVVTPLDGLRLKDLMGAHVAVVLGAAIASALPPLRGPGRAGRPAALPARTGRGRTRGRDGRTRRGNGGARTRTGRARTTCRSSRAGAPSLSR